MRKAFLFAIWALQAMACAGPGLGADAAPADETDSRVGQVDSSGEVVFMTDTPSLADDIEGRLEVSNGPDAAPELPGLRCEPGEGCFLDQCLENVDCQSGWCVEHMGEKVCSLTCEEECPQGWLCTQVGSGGPDLVFVCVSNYPNLCRPCAEADDCAGAAGTEDACVAYGNQGSFCGGACGDPLADAGQACPWGFSCKTVATVDGVGLEQCVADTGECPCTNTSVELGLWTPCGLTNEFGSCEGMRTCTEEGLSLCDAAQPGPEECNGADDDCDGEVDEPDLVEGNYVNLCHDGNDCTEDKCEGVEGCVNEVAESGPCDDLNPCTVADHCVQGVCLSDPVECDDENVCTDNVCTETGGCEYPPNTQSCDDSNPCTLADQCVAGECVGTTVPCDCLTDEDCVPLEDGDLCNGTLVCDDQTLPYKCAVDQATIITCPAPGGIDSFCLQAHCDPPSGECSLVPDHEGFLCAGASACTVNDKCTEGSCGGGQEVNCNDGNPCTDDSCNPEVGCEHTDNQAPCNDGDVCTTADQCAQGACAGGLPLECNDDDVCNGEEKCDAAVGCMPGQPLDCDDGNPCTTGESCHPMNGCVPGTAVGCDDSDPCTLDECQPGTGQCLHTPLCEPKLCFECVCAEEGGEVTYDPLDCDDGNECTVDWCNPATGECAHGGVDCSDDDICTDNECDPLLGCLATLNEAPCDDGNICTLQDRCKSGQCMGGQALECDDGNSCTDDGCDQDAGCQFLPNDDECDDGNACTEGDECAGRWCVSGAAVECDDQNSCTDDGCDQDAGCQFLPNDGDCSDGDPCTVGDLCVEDACVPGPPLECDDGNPCTVDGCKDPGECTHANAEDNTPCNPDEPQEVCVQGSCTCLPHCDGKECGDDGCNGACGQCDDENICTDDDCGPDGLCIYSHNQVGCEDGDPCTLNDECSAGACQPGAGVLACDDQDPCTEDACLAFVGCDSTPLPENTDCGDGKVCLLGECILPLKVDSVTPDSGYAKDNVDATIDGSGFAPGATVTFDQTTIPVTEVTSQAVKVLIPAGIEEGLYHVTVTNPDEQADTLENGYSALLDPADYGFVWLASKSLWYKEVYVPWTEWSGAYAGLDYAHRATSGDINKLAQAGLFSNGTNGWTTTQCHDQDWGTGGRTWIWWNGSVLWANNCYPYPGAPQKGHLIWDWVPQ